MPAILLPRVSKVKSDCQFLLTKHI